MSAQPYEMPEAMPQPTIRSVRDALPVDLQPIFTAELENTPGPAVPADLALWGQRSRAYRDPGLSAAAARAERIQQGEEELVVVSAEQTAALLPGLPITR